MEWQGGRERTVVRLVMPRTKTIASRMLDLPLPFLWSDAELARARRSSWVASSVLSRSLEAALRSSRPGRRVLFGKRSCCLVIPSVLSVPPHRSQRFPSNLTTLKTSFQRLSAPPAPRSP